MMGKDYVEIGTCFEKALDGIPVALSFERAVRIMKTKPDLVARIPAWDEMMWLNVEEYLNSRIPTPDADRDELFVRACALLDG